MTHEQKSQTEAQSRRGGPPTAAAAKAGSLAGPAALQRAIGNRAMGQLLAGPTPAGGRLLQRWDPYIGYDPDYEPPPPPTETEVTVIDDRDFVGWSASATRIGEVYMTNVRSMVDNVLRRAGSLKISRLNILDHGNATGMEFGDDWISASTLSRFSRELSRLRGTFTSSGFVHLQGCNVGNSRAVVVGLARILGVPVYAGTGGHNPVYRVNFGQYVRGMPDGRFDTNVPRP